VGDLDQRDRDLLDFAALTWKNPGRRESAILDRFGMSAARYHQAVLALLDRTEAWAYAPTTVKRLLRLRDRARDARSRQALNHR